MTVLTVSKAPRTRTRGEGMQKGLGKGQLGETGGEGRGDRQQLRHSSLHNLLPKHRLLRQFHISCQKLFELLGVFLIFIQMLLFDQAHILQE